VVGRPRVQFINKAVPSRKKMDINKQIEQIDLDDEVVMGDVVHPAIHVKIPKEKL